MLLDFEIFASATSRSYHNLPQTEQQYLQIYKTIRSHFQGQFEDETIQTVEPLERQPQIFDFPVTKEEAISSIRKLQSNRPAEYDNISAKLIEYGPENHHNILSAIMNEAFEKNVDIETGIGILVPLLCQERLKARQQRQICNSQSKATLNYLATEKQKQ